MVHLDYDDPPHFIWIIRRNQRLYRGYQTVELANGIFWIDEEARQRSFQFDPDFRVLSAWVEGQLISCDKERESLDELVEVRYHPREVDHFFRVDSRQRVKLARYVYFHKDHKAYKLK